jgi:N6-adenosine-specific RNA methylase IME4
MSGELQKLESWRRDLALAETYEEIKMHGDVADAYQHLLKRQNVAKSKQDEVGEYRLEVSRKTAEWLNEHYPSNRASNQYLVGGEKEPSTMPVTKKQSARDRKIEALAKEQPEEYEDLIDEIKNSEKTLSPNTLFDAIKKSEKTKREEKNKSLPKAKLPHDTYRVVYADPPWSYNDKQNTDVLGGAEKHYPTMSIKELCEMELPKIEDNAVLFMWTTSPLLEDAFKVISAWGFKYKSSFVWDKVKHNMGHYNSVRHEFLLVATKGSCTPDKKKLFDSVQSIERSEKHSQKPNEFRDIIDTLYTHGSKIELFSRHQADGWDSFGNEI